MLSVKGHMNRSVCFMLVLQLTVTLDVVGTSLIRSAAGLCQPLVHGLGESYQPLAQGPVNSLWTTAHIKLFLAVARRYSHRLRHNWKQRRRWDSCWPRSWPGFHGARWPARLRLGIEECGHAAEAQRRSLVFGEGLQRRRHGCDELAATSRS